MNLLPKLADPRTLAGAAIAGVMALLLLTGTPLLAVSDGESGAEATVPTESLEPGDAVEPPLAAASGCARWGRNAQAGKPSDGRGRAGGAGAGRGESMGCGCCRHRGSRGQGGQGRGAAMQGGRMRGGHRALMESVWTLVDRHEVIERKIEEIPGGVRTVTTSADPDLVPVIRQHVREMADLIEDGGRIRAWDPLFAEIFDHADAIEIVIEDIEGGVVVTETSQDEEVAKLILAHAYKVLDFVERGDEAYRESTPLPDDYSPAGR